MFRPITAFDADICLIRLKRGMRKAVRSAAIGLRRSPETTPDAPNAIRRPPGREQLVAAPQALAADRVHDQIELRQAPLPAALV